AVLADGRWSLGCPVVLGERTRPGRGRRGRPGTTGRLGPGRLHHLSRRDLPGAAQLGRDGLPHARLLQRGRAGRPLRRLGGAGPLRDRDASRLQLAPLTGTATSEATTVPREA